MKLISKCVCVYVRACVCVCVCAHACSCMCVCTCYMCECSTYILIHIANITHLLLQVFSSNGDHSNEGE